MTTGYNGDPWTLARTLHDFPADEVISSLQKEIRLQVRAGHHQRIGAGAVEARQQLQDFAFEPLLLVGRQRGEGAVHRAVEGAEHVHPVLSRFVAEHELARTERVTIRLTWPKMARSNALRSLWAIASISFCTKGWQRIAPCP